MDRLAYALPLKLLPMMRERGVQHSHLDIERIVAGDQGVHF